MSLLLNTINYKYDFRDLNVFEAYKLNKASLESTENLTSILLQPGQNSSVLDKCYQISHLSMTVEEYLKKSKKMSSLRKLFNIVTIYKVKALKRHLWVATEAVKNLTPTETLENDRMTIQHKITLLSKVQTELSKKQHFSSTAKQVDAYFQYKMACLQNGLNVALPFPCYYHSTKERNFDALVSSQKIMQTPAQCGLGAYISTNIEYQSYGPYAFAIEGNAVQSLKATYVNGFDAHDYRPYESVWMRVEHDIPVNTRTICHLTVESSRMCSSMVKRIQKLGLGVPVLTRKASYMIDDLFKTIVPQYRFPQNWTNRLRQKMPDNVLEYTAALA